jgi:type II secretory pathway component PulF
MCMDQTQNQELIKKIEEMDEKIDKMFKTVEKLRKYFFWTGVITIVLFVVPLIGLIFVIPQFLSTYTSSMTLPN